MCYPVSGIELASGVLSITGSVAGGAYWCAESAVEGDSSREGLATARIQSVQETQSGEQSHDLCKCITAHKWSDQCILRLHN